MLVENLLTDVMDAMDQVDDPKGILRAANRVIEQINGVIRGIKEIEQGIVDGVAQAGYTWNTPELIIPRRIKEILEVWVNDGNVVVADIERVKSEAYSVQDVLTFDEAAVYCMPASNLLRFARNHPYLTEARLCIDLHVYRVFDRVNPDDPPIELEFPEQWNAGFTAGVLSRLAITRRYRDVDIYEENRDLFAGLLGEIDRWEQLRYPQIQGRGAYNYQFPGK